MWPRRARAQVGPVQRRRQDVSPLRVFERGKIRFAADAGVVDEDVDPAECLDGRVDETRGRCGIADVGERNRRSPAVGADLGGDGVGLGACALCADQDRGTAVREPDAMARPIFRALPVTTATRPTSSFSTLMP